jgi:flagellar basal-body rod protein FlgB
MSINFDNAFGIHPQALKVRDQRAELLASNLANADTPNYKARDLDFRSILKGVQPSSLKLATTQPGHQQFKGAVPGQEPLYRNPHQPSLDGNTVESEQEHIRFAENALQYQASLNFLDGKISGLRTAIRGE